MLALVHRVDFHKLVESFMGELLIRQLTRDNTGDETVIRQHGIREHSH